MLPARILSYLTSQRKLTPQTLQIFKIGWCPKRRRIVIPITRPDGSTFNKYRRDPDSDKGEKFISDKGGKRTLFNAQELNTSDIIYICEGEMDAIRLAQTGRSAVASTSGANNWDKSWGPLFKDKEVVIVYDNDDAGKRGAVQVAENIAPYAESVETRCYLGTDGKDVTDILNTHGDQAIDEKSRFKVNRYPKYPVPMAPPDRTELPPTGNYERMLAERVPHYKRRGKELYASCPFHSDRKPSFGMNADTGLWFCHGCGEKGNATQFLERIDGVDWRRAKEIIREQYV